MNNRELYKYVSSYAEHRGQNLWLFVDKDNKPLHKPTYCRDWFLELLCLAHGYSTRKKSFFNHQMEALPLDSLRFVVRSSKSIKNLQETLNEISAIAGVSGPKITRLVPRGHYYLIEAPAFWMSTTVHLSFFTGHIKLEKNRLDNHHYLNGRPPENKEGDRLLWAKVLGKIVVSHVSNSSHSDYNLQHQQNGFFTCILAPQTRYHRQMIDGMMALRAEAL